MNITDINYINFRRVVDKSILGKILCKDLHNLILNHLKENCFKCFSCHKIDILSPYVQRNLFEYAPRTGKKLYTCSNLCHKNLVECINVCKNFGDYDD